MRAYRKLLRIPWTARRTNESVSSELSVEKNGRVNFILRMKLDYFGYIKRRHDTLERLVLEGQVSETRFRGRLKSDWEDDVKKTFGSIVRAGRSADYVQLRKAIRVSTS